MAEKQNLANIKDKILSFYAVIKDKYPVKKIILYGSHSRGTNKLGSDIDVGVIIDIKDHLKRIEITSDLFHYSGKIDIDIEPKCIFYDEYENCDKASIINEIKKTGITII